MEKRRYKPAYSTEFYLQRIKDYYSKHGRLPRYEDCGQFTGRVLARRGINWQTAIRMAVGESVAPTYRQDLNDDVFAQLIMNTYRQKNRILLKEDFTQRDIRQIEKRFGNITRVNERFIGDSLRYRILLVLQELTPAGVEGATTAEIHSLIVKKGFNITPAVVRGLLEFSKTTNLVTTSTLVRIVLWNLTAHGIQFINNIKKGKKDGNRTR